MKIQFDSNQQYQLDAINAVVDLFEGQPFAESVSTQTPQNGSMFDHITYGNQLLLEDEVVLSNLQGIQQRNELDISTKLDGLNFGIEMETGTGKTYVYLRTIFELYLKYGWSKYVIVVPTVAIREGVLNSLQLMAEHFQDLYNRLPYRYFVYDSKRLTEIRNFAVENTLTIMIMNIDAFNKTGNVIRRSDDALAGYSAVEFIQSLEPIVILDEPQKLEGERATEAINLLNPLMTFRYSATLGKIGDRIYNLDPVKAYDLGLVKRIEVDGVVEDANFNQPHIIVREIKTSKNKPPIATMEVDVQQANSVKRKSIRVRGFDDLQEITGRDLYSGYIIDDVNAYEGQVLFANGLSLDVMEEHGTSKDAIMKEQISQTVRRHLERELKFARRPDGQKLKVLSLFFIDRVANYINEEGVIKKWFIEAYSDLSKLEKYKLLNLPAVETVHKGYFASDQNGPKDTSGKTQADDDAYKLIMQDKARLLSFDTPVRFIFSHSALNEGWDNPNVFQICVLRETHSLTSRRQQIGRGLRLPVLESGERSFDDNVNVLTVIANETYNAFAEGLQQEIHSETNIEFSKNRVANARQRQEANLNKEVFLSEEFKELWERIKHKTRYAVHYDTIKLIQVAASSLKESNPITAPKIKISSGRILRETNLDYEMSGSRSVDLKQDNIQIPDIISYLQKATDFRLTRTTIVEILRSSQRIGDILINPQSFLDIAVRAINSTLYKFMIEGIKYEKIDEHYEMSLFESDELTGYLTSMIATPKHSLYHYVIFQSGVERDFAQKLDSRDDIKVFVKLPSWFVIETPIGTYNPDWALVKEDDNTLYFVRETKSTDILTQLREDERHKIYCGTQHFATLGVDYKVVKSADQI